MASWTAARFVLAITWALRTARRNAAAVLGYLSSHDWVAVYPLTGRLCAGPWSTSAMATAPTDSSAPVRYGSGVCTASTLCAAGAAALFGDGVNTKRNLFYGSPLSGSR